MSREEAIAKGMLFDVSDWVGRFVQIPTCFTKGLMDEIQSWADGGPLAGRDEAEIIAIQGVMNAVVMKSARDNDSLLMSYVQEAQCLLLQTEIGVKDIKHIMAAVGPDDNGRPVVTVGFPAMSPN